MRRVVFVACVVAALTLASAAAEALTITFETLADSEVVTTQFPGLTFSNTVVLTEGVSLNEFEFPPNSGINVVFDGGGAITLTLAVPVVSVSAFLTYTVPVTLTAFDSLSNPVAFDVSDFSSNLALSGDAGSTPNELFKVEFGGGISSVTFEGDVFGGSFTLDDLTVPAPATLVLAVAGVAALGTASVSRRIRRRRRP